MMPDFHFEKRRVSCILVQRMKNKLKRVYVNTCLEKYKNDSKKNSGTKLNSFGNPIRTPRQRLAISAPLIMTLTKQNFSINTLEQ